MKRVKPHWRLLLAHEFRLTWRRWRLDKWAKGTAGGVTLFVLLAILLHLAFWMIVALIPGDAPTSSRSVLWIGVITLMFAAFMSATALSRSVEALFERNDIDLLFSAPVSPRAVLIVRTLMVAGATLLGHAIYLLPLANMAMLTGRTWLWALYVVAPLTALFSAAFGMLLSLTLVKLLGARRTRTLVQVIAVIAGSLGFLFTQFGSRATQSIDLSGASSTAIGLIGALQWFASLVMGDPYALLALMIACAATCTLAWLRLDRAFLRGSQETIVGRATVSQRPRRTRTRRQSSRASTGVCVKEWRGIVRDPLLLTRIGASLIYIAPLLVLIWRRDNSNPSFDIAAAAATSVILAHLLAQQLAVLTVNMEDAPHLLLASPRSIFELLEAKAAAAAIPAAALAIALLCLTASFLGTVLLLAAPVVAAAAWSSASVVASRVRFVPRVDFGKRKARPDVATGMLILSVGLLFSGAGALLVSSYWWAAIPILAAAVLVTLHQRRKLSRIRADALIHT